MEGYCQQCIYTDREKPHKEFVNYDILIYCKKLKKDVSCYGKEVCFEENRNWQHLNDL